MGQEKRPCRVWHSQKKIVTAYHRKKTKKEEWEKRGNRNKVTNVEPWKKDPRVTEHILFAVLVHGGRDVDMAGGPALSRGLRVCGGLCDPRDVWNWQAHATEETPSHKGKLEWGGCRKEGRRRWYPARPKLSSSWGERLMWCDMVWCERDVYATVVLIWWSSLGNRAASCDPHRCASSYVRRHSHRRRHGYPMLSVQVRGSASNSRKGEGCLDAYQVDDGPDG